MRLNTALGAGQPDCMLLCALPAPTGALRFCWRSVRCVFSSHWAHPLAPPSTAAPQLGAPAPYLHRADDAHSFARLSYPCTRARLLPTTNSPILPPTDSRTMPSGSSSPAAPPDPSGAAGAPSQMSTTVMAVIERCSGFGRSPLLTSPGSAICLMTVVCPGCGGRVGWYAPDGMC